MPSRTGILAAGLAALAVDLVAANSDSCSSNTLSVDYPDPVIADGWSYRLIANDFTSPRGLLFDNDGGLLVVDEGVGVSHLALSDDGGTCLSVSKKTSLIEADELNHGLALSEDGKTLYASSSDKVYSWSYDSSAVTVSDNNRTLVTNMSNSDHTTRTLFLSRKQPGILLVSRGSDSNMDEDAMQMNSGHAQVRSFNISKLGDNDDPYQFLDGHVLGWGLRNSVGVTEHPDTGGIWTVENSVDEMHRDGKDIHQDNPAEEMNFLGYLNGSTEHQGGNYGYPECYTLWSKQGVPGVSDLSIGDQFPDSETSALNDKTCNDDFVAPRLAFQAHMAPLDIKFTDDGDTAYVSFHGSWDRTNPVGYRIVSVDFSDGSPTEPSTSTSAATDIITNPDLSKCPDSCFRPVGLAWDSQSRLWFTSDATGEVFVMQQDNSGNSGKGSSGDDDGDSAGAQLVPMKAAAWAVTLGAVALGLLLS